MAALKAKIVNDAIVAVIELQHAKDDRLSGLVLYKGDANVSSKLRFLRLLIDRSDEPVVVDYLTDMRKIVATLQIVNNTASAWEALVVETRYITARTLVKECLQ